ncbi:hypothetical protein K523DRAFT_109459 [Schizophyllum commune Tattone D]|nr:hypothetical protein K523DRAFT_109459 [Schizophyllum commune Tattone D]
MFRASYQYTERPGSGLRWHRSPTVMREAMGSPGLAILVETSVSAAGTGRLC